MQADDLDEALAIIERPARERKPVSVGLLGNAAEMLPELLRRGVRPDVRHRPDVGARSVNGYLPKGWTRRRVGATGASATRRGRRGGREASIAEHVRAMLAFHRMGMPTLDYGNNIRQVAQDEGVDDAFDFPGFVPAYIRPLFCRGIGPFRWAALSGDPEDIYRTDAKVKELLPDDAHLHHWLDMARERIQLPGPAGAHLLGRAGRPRIGSASPSTTWSRSGELKAPIVIGRDHLDCRLGRDAPTARPKRCATARTPCPTGRCSTRCSTARRARPGCRSIMAAASAWATRSMPAW